MMRNNVCIKVALFWVVILVSGLNVPCFASSTSNIAEQIEMVCKAVEQSIQGTYQGTGVARVYIYNESPTTSRHLLVNPDTGTTIEIPPDEKSKIEKEELLIDFRFKGKSTRADQYELVNMERGKLLRSFIDTPESSINYTGSYVSIRPAHSNRHFYRMVGYDFHPEALIRMDMVPFREEMEALLKYAKTINIFHTDEGFLRIERDGDLRYNRPLSVFLILEPKADFRPREYITKTENDIDEYGTVISVHYQAEWRQYGSTWYIKGLKYEYTREHVKSKELDSRHRIEIYVDKFDPEIKVDDEKFMISSMPIPTGTTVHDSIIGINYKY